MKSVSGLVLAAVATAAAASIPTIPSDWSALVLQGVRIIQGDGVVIPGQGVLCPYAATNCKVQTVFEAGIQYFDFTNNRTALKGSNGAGIVTLYKLGKEFQVDAQGNCQAYCPLTHQESTIEPLVIDPKSEDKGTVVYNGQTVHQYQSDVPLIETEDWYVTVSGSTATPVADIQLVYFLGLINTTSNMTFLNFKAGPQPASQFTVNGISSCPQAQQCASDDDAPHDDNPFPGSDDSSAHDTRYLGERSTESLLRAATTRNMRSSAEFHRMSPLYYSTFIAPHLDE